MSVELHNTMCVECGVDKDLFRKEALSLGKRPDDSLAWPHIAIEAWIGCMTFDYSALVLQLINHAM